MESMTLLGHEQAFWTGHETVRQVVIKPAGSSVQLEVLTPDGWVPVGDPYTTGASADITMKPNVNWRVSYGDSGVAAKAYLSSE